MSVSLALICTVKLTHVPADSMRPEARRQRELSLAALATRQHGVVARSQLIEMGLGRGAIEDRVRSGRLHVLHRGVYALGHASLTQQGRWLAAVLAHGDGALLSHQSAAASWGLTRERGRVVDVTSRRGRPGRPGIRLHRGRVHADEAATRGIILVTSVARTVFDLAEVVDEVRLGRAFEEADRLGLLELGALERVCARCHGRRGLAVVNRLIAHAREPASARSALEEGFAELCSQHELPPPVLNAGVLDFVVDALWPQCRLIVELDGFAFHRHRAAFERDRARDATLLAAGYRVMRLTHRRLVAEPKAVVAELRRLLGENADTAASQRRRMRESSNAEPAGG